MHYQGLPLKLCLTILLWTAGFEGVCQNLNGIWKGTMILESRGCFPIYYVELQVGASGNSLSGSIYHYSDVLNYVKKNYDGKYDSVLRSLSIQERKLVTYNIPSHCVLCIRYFTLAYSNSGAEEMLSGECGGIILNQTNQCTRGNIILKRIKESEFAHIKEIKVDTGVIRLDFYDNAEIDGDSITVKLNGQTLISRQLLRATPITREIKVDLNQQVQEITMIADNLGSIPPNTALLIATAGNKKYQLFLASDKKRTAQVNFIYEKPIDK